MAVLIHDFSDGINTIGVILKNRGTRGTAFRWLILDAVAPIVGAASTMILDLQAPMLGLSLAGIAGFFLYIGARDLLPESYREHQTILTTVMAVLGAVLIFIAVQLANA
jgi:ZIP family zinc transporter